MKPEDPKLDDRKYSIAAVAPGFFQASATHYYIMRLWAKTLGRRLDAWRGNVPRPVGGYGYNHLRSST